MDSDIKTAANLVKWDTFSSQKLQDLLDVTIFLSLFLTFVSGFIATFAYNKSFQYLDTWSSY